MRSSLPCARNTGGVSAGTRVGAAWHAVLEHDTGDALRIEPRGDFLGFDLPEEGVIAAPRTDQHRRSIVLVLGRSYEGDRWIADVGDEPGRLGDLDAILGRPL